MAESAGRDLLIQRSTDGGTTYTTIASVRTKSVAINNEPIDITTDDSNAYRTLLTDAANRTLDLSVSGVMKDYDLMEETLNTTLAMQDIKIVFEDTSDITGDFFITTFTVTGEYQDATTFEMEMQSSGTYTYTTP